MLTFPLFHQSSQSVKYDNDAMDQMEIERLHLSPLSTWDASVSTETGSSTESWRSANGKYTGAWLLLEH